MKESSVRIKQIIIQDLKNVKYGVINFENNKKIYKASILGLYGQNGSGKTTLIDALELLKNALCGRSIPAKFGNYVNVEACFAKLSYLFTIEADDGIYEVCYEFCLKKDKDNSEQNMDNDNVDWKIKAVIYDEILKCSFKSYEDQNKKTRMNLIVNTKTDKPFIPSSKYMELVGNDKKTETDLLVAKGIAKSKSQTFIFSRELLNVMKKKNREVNSEVSNFSLWVIERLIRFGHYELFIIQTQSMGVIYLDMLPLSFKYTEKKNTSVGQFLLRMDSETVIPEGMASLADKVMNSMNIVLCQVVPGLKVSIKRYEPQVMENGNEGVRVQLMSEKDGVSVPLKYESEGIKKIISVLSLLIAVYNQPSITVAIDGLDSGVFEYLLGELLRVISEKGKGQLIFTSHNLRPLETLDIGFIAFTTTNPSNRYVRITNVKKSNNLRSYYYRDMILGISKETLYDITNNAEIDMAFQEAGEINGT